MWGLGQRPNCSTGDQFKEKSPQRRRQRSVPASNFALPQERPPSCSFQHLCCVAPDGRDRIACLPDIACLSHKQGFRLCGRDKRAFWGHSTSAKRRRRRPSSSWEEAAKGVPSRFCSLRAENRHERAVPRHGVYAAVREWENTRSGAASAGENDDDGSKIPGGVQPRPRGQLGEAG